MDLFLRSLNRDPGIFLLLAILVTLVALAFSFSTYIRLRKYEKKWKLLWMGSQGASVEDLLHEHLEERILVNQSLDSLGSRLTEIEGLMRTAKRHLGLVRFDAFPDVAGSQSFALAVFDDEGDGAILSSIVGRNSCRVYCKPVVGGRSERDLSQEEQRAIKLAKEGGVRTIFSP